MVKIERCDFMHTMWKGSISFGLVHIPIKLYAATEDKDIKFRSLHKECNNPIKYEKVCPVCDKEVANDDIVKGYEYEPGKYVIIDQDELKELSNSSSKRIDIIDFVNLTDIDPIYFNRSYFIGPNDNGSKPYLLLKKAIEDTKKIGIAKITIRSKQQLAIVRSYQNGLVMETIHWPDEVRAINNVPAIPEEEIELDQKEIDMATTLVEQLTTSFEPEKYTDEYRGALMDLIESKMNNQEFTTAEEKQETNIIDLMDALQESIDNTKPKKKKRTRKKKVASGE
jgi:DNA end-binding protein Ku